MPVMQAGDASQYAFQFSLSAQPHAAGPSNVVKTTRYTVQNFLPKQLFEQFKRYSNWYFLLIAMLQLFTTLSPTNKYSTILPLAMVILASMIRSGAEDLKRARADQLENSQPVLVLHGKSVHIASRRQLRPGDLVFLQDGETVPADVVLLASSNTRGQAMVQTSSIDGETNLKTRQALPEVQGRVGPVLAQAAQADHPVAEAIQAALLANRGGGRTSITTEVPARRQRHDSWAADRTSLAGDRLEPPTPVAGNSRTGTELPSSPGRCSSYGAGMAPKRALELLRGRLEQEVAAQLPHIEGTMWLAEPDPAINEFYGQAQVYVQTFPSLPTPATGGAGKFDFVDADNIAEASPQSSPSKFSSPMTSPPHTLRPAAILGISPAASPQQEPDALRAAGAAQVPSRRRPVLRVAASGPRDSRSSSNEGPSPPPSASPIPLASPGGRPHAGSWGSCQSAMRAIPFSAGRTSSVCEPGDIQLGVPQLMLRGTALRTTSLVLAVVAYTGRHTKMALNARDPPSKTSRLDQIVNRGMQALLIGLALLCAGNGVYEAVLRRVLARHVSYLPFLSGNTSVQQLALQMVTSLILFNNVVPISLYVTLELVRWWQARQITNDRSMLYGTLPAPQARSSDVNADLGLVDFVFTDKTGTLTRNEMSFIKCVVGQAEYGHGKVRVPVEELRQAERLLMNLFEEDGLLEPLRSTINRSGGPHLPLRLSGTSRSIFRNPSGGAAMSSWRTHSQPVAFMDGLQSFRSRPMSAYEGASLGTRGTIGPPNSVQLTGAGGLSSDATGAAMPSRVISHEQAAHGTNVALSPPFQGGTGQPMPPYALPGAIGTTSGADSGLERGRAGGGSGVGVIGPLPVFRSDSGVPRLGGGTQPMQRMVSITTGLHRNASARGISAMDASSPDQSRSARAAPHFSASGPVPGTRSPVVSSGRQLSGFTDVDQRMRDLEQLVGGPLPLSFKLRIDHTRSRLGRGRVLLSESRFQRMLKQELHQLAKRLLRIRLSSQSLFHVNPHSKFAFHDQRLLQAILTGSEQGLAVAEFFVCSAICHSLIPRRVGATYDGSSVFSYQGASPDEMALAEAAQAFGVQLLESTEKYVKLSLWGQPVVYDKLLVNGFSSSRRRMSVLVRTPRGRYVLYVKGADSAVLPCSWVYNTRQHMNGTTSVGLASGASRSRSRSDSYESESSTEQGLSAIPEGETLGSRDGSHRAPEDEADEYRPVRELVLRGMPRRQRDDELAQIQQVREGIVTFAKEGLRTLVLAKRELSSDVVDALVDMRARANMERDHSAQLAHVASLAEVELTVLGGSAIEDKLQAGVPNAITALGAAGVRTWMCTGDKSETAINIAHAANLLQDDMYLVVLNADTQEEAVDQLGKARASLRAAEKWNPDLVNARLALVIEGGCLQHLLPMRVDMQADTAVHAPESSASQYFSRSMHTIRQFQSHRSISSLVSTASKSGRSMRSIPPASSRKSSHRTGSFFASQRGFSPSTPASARSFGTQLTARSSMQGASSDDDSTEEYGEQLDCMGRVDVCLSRMLSGLLRAWLWFQQYCLRRPITLDQRLFTESVLRGRGGNSTASLVSSDANGLDAADGRVKTYEREVMELAQQCSSVIACRLSPLQKAQLIRLMKRSRTPAPVCLAIGDGGNDVSMIQEANVGVGMFGSEGTAAVRASDFAISQFRFLLNLMLVHGQRNLYRSAVVIGYSFYKNAVLVTTLLLFNFVSAASGSTMFESFLGAMWNLLFTSLPLIVFGATDELLSEREALNYPSTYLWGARGNVFSVRTILTWVVTGVIDAVLIWAVLFMSWLTPFTELGMWVQGAGYNLAMVVGTNVRLLFHMHGMNMLVLAASLFSVALWFGFVLVWSVGLREPLDLRELTSDFHGVCPHLLSPAFGLVVLLGGCMPLVAGLAWAGWTYNRPTVVQLLREMVALGTIGRLHPKVVGRHVQSRLRQHLAEQHGAASSGAAVADQAALAATTGLQLVSFYLCIAGQNLRERGQDKADIVKLTTLQVGLQGGEELLDRAGFSTSKSGGMSAAADALTHVSTYGGTPQAALLSRAPGIASSTHGASSPTSAEARAQPPVQLASEENQLLPVSDKCHLVQIKLLEEETRRMRRDLQSDWVAEVARQLQQARAKPAPKASPTNFLYKSIRMITLGRAGTRGARTEGSVRLHGAGTNGGVGGMVKRGLRRASKLVGLTMDTSRDGAPASFSKEEAQRIQLPAGSDSDQLAMPQEVLSSGSKQGRVLHASAASMSAVPEHSSVCPGPGKREPSSYRSYSEQAQAGVALRGAGTDYSHSRSGLDLLCSMNSHAGQADGQVPPVTRPAGHSGLPPTSGRPRPAVRAGKPPGVVTVSPSMSAEQAPAPGTGSGSQALPHFTLGQSAEQSPSVSGRGTSSHAQQPGEDAESAHAEERSPVRGLSVDAGLPRTGSRAWQMTSMGSPAVRPSYAQHSPMLSGLSALTVTRRRSASLPVYSTEPDGMAESPSHALSLADQGDASGNSPFASGSPTRARTMSRVLGTQLGGIFGRLNTKELAPQSPTHADEDASSPAHRNSGGVNFWNSPFAIFYANNLMHGIAGSSGSGATPAVSPWTLRFINKPRLERRYRRTYLLGRMLWSARLFLSLLLLQLAVYAGVSLALHGVVGDGSVMELVSSRVYLGITLAGAVTLYLPGYCSSRLDDRSLSRLALLSQRAVLLYMLLSAWLVPLMDATDLTLRVFAFQAVMLLGMRLPYAMSTLCAVVAAGTTSTRLLLQGPVLGLRGAEAMVSMVAVLVCAVFGNYVAKKMAASMRKDFLQTRMLMRELKRFSRLLYNSMPPHIASRYLQNVEQQQAEAETGGGAAARKRDWRKARGPGLSTRHTILTSRSGLGMIDDTPQRPQRSRSFRSAGRGLAGSIGASRAQLPQASSRWGADSTNDASRGLAGQGIGSNDLLYFDQEESVTVVFVDLMDFHALVQSHTPADLIELLDRLYGLLDVMAGKHGVYKMETVGKTWMGAAGLQRSRDDHATVCIKFGLDVIASLQQLCDREDSFNVHVRIGVHSGHAVSGMFGRKKPQFCLVGDTVNTASRMQSKGEVDCVHVSEDSWNMTKGVFVGEQRSIEAKGKGRMTTYLVLRHKDAGQRTRNRHSTQDSMTSSHERGRGYDTPDMVPTSAHNPPNSVNTTSRASARHVPGRHVLDTPLAVSDDSIAQMPVASAGVPASPTGSLLAGAHSMSRHSTMDQDSCLDADEGDHAGQDGSARAMAQAGSFSRPRGSRRMPPPALARAATGRTRSPSADDFARPRAKSKGVQQLRRATIGFAAIARMQHGLASANSNGSVTNSPGHGMRNGGANTAHWVDMESQAQARRLWDERYRDWQADEEEQLAVNLQRRQQEVEYNKYTRIFLQPRVEYAYWTRKIVQRVRRAVPTVAVAVAMAMVRAVADSTESPSTQDAGLTLGLRSMLVRSIVRVVLNTLAAVLVLVIWLRGKSVRARHAQAMHELSDGYKQQAGQTKQQQHADMRSLQLQLMGLVLCMLTLLLESVVLSLSGHGLVLDVLVWAMLWSCTRVAKLPYVLGWMLVAALAGTIQLVVASPDWQLQGQGAGQSWRGFFWLWFGCALLCISTYLQEGFSRDRFATTWMTRQYTRSASAALYNMLPRAVVLQLQDGRTGVAAVHHGVTILNMDLCGFTRMSSSLEPQQVVIVLNQLFSAFDQLTDWYGIFKVQTIGDAYVAIAGMPYTDDSSLSTPLLSTAGPDNDADTDAMPLGSGRSQPSLDQYTAVDSVGTPTRTQRRSFTSSAMHMRALGGTTPNDSLLATARGAWKAASRRLAESIGAAPARPARARRASFGGSSLARGSLMTSGSGYGPTTSLNRLRVQSSHLGATPIAGLPPSTSFIAAGTTTGGSGVDRSGGSSRELGQGQRQMYADRMPPPLQLRMASNELSDVGAVGGAQPGSDHVADALDDGCLSLGGSSASDSQPLLLEQQDSAGSPGHRMFANAQTYAVRGSALSMLRMALDMLDAVKRLSNPQTGEPLSMRIGLHTGSVVSGVLGTLRPRLDVFGPDVLAAALMEGAAEHDTIAVSEMTKRVLGDVPGLMFSKHAEPVQVKTLGQLDGFTAVVVDRPALQAWRDEQRPPVAWGWASAESAAAASRGDDDDDYL